MKMGSVYFIKAEGHDVFKIGYCDSDLDKRINMLRIGNHLRLSFFGIINHLDALSMERQLHREFADHRLRGEWFSITEEQATDAIRARGGVLLPESYKNLFRTARRRKNEGKHCEKCQKPLPGRRQKYCSEACRQFAYRDRILKSSCKCGCGGRVTGKRLYIDDAHKQRAYNKRKQEEATT